MIQKIKDALNSTVTWFLFLIGCVLFFWKKERDLADELKEQKFDDSLKETKNEQVKIDSDAAYALANYERLRDVFKRGTAGLPSGTIGGGSSDPSPTETDSDKGSKN